jgi:hypothetical protein
VGEINESCPGLGVAQNLVRFVNSFFPVLFFHIKEHSKARRNQYFGPTHLAEETGSAGRSGSFSHNLF